MLPSKPTDGPDNVVPISNGGGPPGGRGGDDAVSARLLAAATTCGCLVGLAFVVAVMALLLVALAKWAL